MSNRKKNEQKNTANLGSYTKEIMADAYKEQHPPIYHRPAKRKY